MGAALATRLQGCGHDLVVWNRTPDKAKGLVEAGAVLADSPAAVVEQSEAIITCLLDARRPGGGVRRRPGHSLRRM